MVSRVIVWDWKPPPDTVIFTNHKNTFCSLNIIYFLSFYPISAEDDDEDDIRVEELGDEDDDEEDDDEDDDEEEGVNEAFIAVRTSHIEYTYLMEWLSKNSRRFIFIANLLQFLRPNIIYFISLTHYSCTISEVVWVYDEFSI